MMIFKIQSLILMLKIFNLKNSYSNSDGTEILPYYKLCVSSQTPSAICSFPQICVKIPHLFSINSVCVCVCVCVVGDCGTYCSFTAFEQAYKQLLFCSITLDSTHSTRDEVAGKGHTLKIDPTQYGQMAARGKKNRHNESSVTPSNSAFLPFYGDIVQQPCPPSSLRASLHVSEMERMGMWSVSHV